MKGLQLLAYDKQDLLIIATQLEKADTRINMMKFDKNANKFAMMLFRKDRIKQRQKQIQIWKSALVINHVLRVEKTQKYNFDNQQDIQLLTIYVAEKKAENEQKNQDKQIILIFDHDFVIRIKAECIDISMQDMLRLTKDSEISSSSSVSSRTI